MIGNSVLTIVVIVLASVLQLGSCYEEKRSYSGYTLFRSLPQTDDQVNQLRSLLKEESDDGLQFWKEPRGVNASVDIMVPPEAQKNITGYLESQGIPTEIVIQDIGRLIKKTNRMSRLSKHDHLDDSKEDSDNPNFIDYKQPGPLDAEVFYSAYHRYATIEQKLRKLGQDSRVTIELAGSSGEGRQIYLVKVSTDFSAKKPVIFVDAGHHAREWISHAIGLYLLEGLINENMPERIKIRSEFYMQNVSEAELSRLKGQVTDKLRPLLQKYDFWFVPVVNPDGYEYTHKRDRLWRKTRSRSSGLCYGVDPNRNYPFHWAESGASKATCSEVYAGPRALSEKEAQAVANLLKTHSQRISMYLSLHAYSQLILMPYGYAEVYPENYYDMKRVADAGIQALSLLRGTRYEAGPSSIILYPAAGGSDDYAYSLGIKHAYTIELPDRGKYGFVMPPYEIVPIAQEIVLGISAMIEAM